MIGSIISAILWFLVGVAVTCIGALLFMRYCYKEIGGKKGCEENKDEIIDAGMEMFEIMFGDESDKDAD